MLRTFLRVGVLAATSLAVLFAVLFTIARIGSLFAPNFVENLNRQYAEQEIVFAELKLRWHGINPVVEIGTVDSAYFHLEDIAAELDTLASFWRNTYVFRTIQVAHASLSMTHHSACSLGLPTLGDASFGLGQIIRYSKNIDISFSSAVSCGSSYFEHEGFFRTVTFGPVYRLHASIRELGECDTCTVSVLYEATKKGFWRRQEERLLNVQVHDFVLPTYLLGWNFLQESLLNAQLLMSGTSRAAALVGSVELHPRTEPENRSRLALDLGFKITNTGHLGKINAALFDHDGDVLKDFEHTVRQNLAADFTHGWSQDVDVAAVSTFMDIFGAAPHPIHERIIGLAPTGTFSWFHWRYDQDGFTYTATGDDLEIQQQGNIPAVFLSSVDISGRGPLVQLETKGNDINLNKSRFLTVPLSLAEVDTTTIAIWNSEFFGGALVGHWTPDPSVPEVSLHIGYRRNLLNRLQRFRVAVDIPSISAAQLQPYVKSFVPTTSFKWIERSVRNAHFDEVSIEYVRSMSPSAAEPATTLEIRAPFYEAEVVFLEAWPRLVAGRGQLSVSRNALYLNVDSAYTQGNHVERGTLSLPFDEPLLDVQFSADMNFLLLQNYLVESPLSGLVPFDPLHFDGSGSMDLTATLKIPLAKRLEHLWDVQLEFLLADVYLDLKPADIQIDDMFGTVGYQYPNQISSTNLTGKFVERPVTLELGTREQATGVKEAVIAFDLNASTRTISRFTGDWIQPITRGFAHINGEMVFPFAPGVPTTVDVHSDLVGIEIHLPDPFYKQEDQERPVHVHLSLDDQVNVEVAIDQISVRAVEIQSALWRGSIGINSEPLGLEESNRQWVVTGSLAELGFRSDSGADMAFPAGLNLEFSNFRIDKLIRGRFQLHDLVLDGTYGGTHSDLQVTAAEGIASLLKEPEANWHLSVEQLRLWHSAFDNPNNTPTDPTVFLQLPPTDITINGLYMFDENGEADDYGSWSFELTTDTDSVNFHNIVADFRGVRLHTTDHIGVVWDTSRNETRFAGVLQGTNLLNVLPQFDVEAEVESESFNIQSDLVWPGSPFDVNMHHLTGRIYGDVSEGSLLEIQAGQGILRLLGVFNIAPIIQRMDFNLAAMFAKGFLYDRIMFDVTLDQAKMIIQEPIHIKGRSSEIRFSGAANLADESLNMDVVFQLPFTSNLKWYVALLTGNPTAFLGTMIGTRIFQPQLDRISSAKYKVSGTFESPEVELIGVFTDDLTTEPIENDTNNED